MVARLTGITEFAAATAFMNNYSFGGIPAVAAVVLAASYFAANDSNLFGSAGALQIMYNMRHRDAVVAVTVLGVLTAFMLSLFGSSKALEGIVSINSVVLPIPTILVCLERWLSNRYRRVPLEWQTPSRAGLIALCAGLTVGIATSGVVPGTACLHVGLPFLQSWILAIGLYVPLRMREYNSMPAYSTASALDRGSTPRVNAT